MFRWASFLLVEKGADFITMVLCLIKTYVLTLHQMLGNIMSTLNEKPLGEMHLFKSRADVMGYVFKTGKSVHFMQGQYATSAKDEIAELTTECENGHPNFYIDPKQVRVSKEELDPMHKIRAQIREEERAKLLAATDINRNMGNTPQDGKLTGISNSLTVSGAMAASESQAIAANPNASRPSIVVPKK